MFTLIRREIEDNWVFFLASVILAGILSMVIVWQQFYFQESEIPRIHDYEFVIAVISLLGFSVIGAGMGVSQMYWDRTKKISALLATLAVSRRQIFISRVILGLLLVFFGPVPVVATGVIASRMIGPAVSVSLASGFVSDLWISIFLFNFSCYCVGLQTGWTSSKLLITLGVFGLCIVLIGLIVIKGVGLETYLILVLFTASCLLRAWHTYSRAAF